MKTLKQHCRCSNPIHGWGVKHWRWIKYVDEKIKPGLAYIGWQYGGDRKSTDMDESEEAEESDESEELEASVEPEESVEPKESVEQQVKHRGLGGQAVRILYGDFSHCFLRTD